MNASNTSIFVQIASYRDPELIPTLRDLIDKAARPRNLRVEVSWQHGPDETLDEFQAKGFAARHAEAWDGWMLHHLEYNGARVELIDVPHLKTGGACWARNLLQQRYGEERYTLQLDSHHRFKAGWDDAALAMLDSLREESPRPIITAYLPVYELEHPEQQLEGPPGILTFDRFSPEGVALFDSVLLPDWKDYDRPVPARFYSAHFAFADGHFAKTVQHDPEFFFLGEEISIAVRAFTHGYDLYHPHRVLASHEYSRRYRVKVWDDHDWRAKKSGVVTQDWVDRNAHSMQRHRELLGVDSQSIASRFGKYGLGTERSLGDYEAYAGISFAYRGVQQAALEHRPPVRGVRRPDSEEAWRATLVRSNDVRVCLHRNAFTPTFWLPAEESALSLATHARIRFYTDDEALLYEKNLDADGLNQCRNNDWLDHPFKFQSRLDQIPTRYVVDLLDKEGKIIATGVDESHAPATPESVRIGLPCRVLCAYP